MKNAETGQPLHLDVSMAIAQRNGARAWKVHPHGQLIELEENLFTVTGTVSMPVGQLPRRMTVARISGHRLVIFSAMSLADGEMARLEELGEPAFMIIPNDHHRMDAPAWKARYPNIRVIGPAGAREKIEKVVLLDATAVDFRDSSVLFMSVAGTAQREAALQVNGPGGTTLVLNDLIGNIRDASGFSGWFLKMMGFAGDEPHIPFPIKRAVIESKGQVRDQLLRWAALPTLQRIIVSHGSIIDDDPRGVLRRLAQSLAAGSGK
jgi:hypothetical protein